jgi:hypothetical protein
VSSLRDAHLIDDFFAQYPATAGGSDKVDSGEADEVVVANLQRAQVARSKPRIL